MESALRPRDIQARIRAGESPEDVAAAARTTVEAIMGFATPVLAERAHVAQIALKASVRRRSGESSSAGRTLGEAAELFFGDHTLHGEDVEWDAWRRPDGRWSLVAAYALGGRPRTAEFTHDLPGRYVVAENDEARILTGELREPESRQPAGDRSAPARRLSSVPFQDELPLGDDAIELVRDREPAMGEPTEVAGVHDSLHRLPDPGADTADADWIAERGAAVRPPDRSASADQVDAGPGAQPVLDPIAETFHETPDDTSDAIPDSGPGATVGNGQPPAQATPAKKKSRSSVPSWDEIMFGGKNE